MTVEINFVRLVIAPYWCVSCEMAHWKEQLQPRGNCVSYGRRGRTFDADLLIAHLHTVRRAGTHTHAQVMLYYADLLKVNLITLVIPDQRVFLPVKNPSSGKKKGEKHDNKSKSDFMKVAPETGQSIRTAAECGRVATRGARRGARRSKAHPPCQRPEAVCPRHKDREVVRTKCTKSHTSSHPLSWPTRQVDAEILGEAERLLVESTGLFPSDHHILLFQLIPWYMMLLWHFPLLLRAPPMSTRLYTEWMIPPKCILEFCTNTFSELSKQCGPLSRCIVYAFFRSVAGMSKWARERHREGQRGRETREWRRERERESDTASFSKRHQLCEQHRQIFHSVSIFLFYVPNR